MTKADAEAANWVVAHEWYGGLDLTCANVNLGDVMEYDVLRVLGGLWKKVLDVPTAQLPNTDLPHA